jgi:phosphatidylserine/phosphatidylglycerophosphate/cardiolipin synthase-like enzyme
MKAKILLMVILVFAGNVEAMYRARCIPFSSMDRVAMKQKFYDLLDNSKATLLVSIFTFVDKEVARKLALARARGVKVKVVMDNSSVRGLYGIKDLLEEFDVPTLIYKSSDSINHNKYVIADGEKSWISSMNFTKPAYTKNRESAVLVDSRAVARFYTKDFKETCKAIVLQNEKERVKKAKFEKDLAMERKKHLEQMRAWRNCH